MLIRRLVLVVTIAALVHCAARREPVQTWSPPPNVDAGAMSVPTSVPVGQYGIGCRTVSEPDTVGPPSYSVDVAGEPGTPSLTQAQVSTIQRIRHYVHSKTLRFALIDGDFIVFDATQGPCSEAASGYWIMNDPHGGNAYYQPGEAPGDIHAGPGDAAPTQGPWMVSPSP